MQFKSVMEKYRAKLEILYYITSFCLSRNYGDGVNRGGISDCYFEPKDRPDVGDLVVLTSAPCSEYYLSWYIGCTPKQDLFLNVHTLKSIETGNICNWSNVSFDRLNRKIVDDHPEWKWTDSQFKFKESWFRACYKTRDAYINRPIKPEFKDDGSVILSIRKMFSSEIVATKIFDNWKRVLVRDMLEFYDSINEV